MKSYRKKMFLAVLCLAVLIVGNTAIGQQLPQEQPPADVSGKWTIYTKSDDGKTSTQYIDLVQNGTTLSGHFKGP